MRDNLLHLSFNPDLDKEILLPRQPDGTELNLKSDFTEHLPDRISFSPTIEHCFMAIYPNISKYFEEMKYPHIDMFVYEGLVTKDTIFIPKKTVLKNVLDAHVTKEVCAISPVKMEKLQKIRIKITNEEIWFHPFNDKKREKLFLCYKPRWELIV